MIKWIIFSTLTIALNITSIVLADETALEHCEGWMPAYFVDLVKIENNNQVTYQVNLQGDATNFKSLVSAKKDYDKKCAMVKSWE